MDAPLDPLLVDVLQVLRLERLEPDLFRGESRDPGHHRVFGGQVLGQALVAAYATLEGRPVHSLHAYFLRAGDPDHPIIYQVDRSRDGGSFSSRRVVALQHGKQIFHMSASFQLKEQGTDSHAPMPLVAAPEALGDTNEAIEQFERRNPSRTIPWSRLRRAFEFRPTIPLDSLAGNEEPCLMIWFRAVDRLPPDPVLQHCLLAYVSDYYLLSVATLRLPPGTNRDHLQIASVDHAMWFHRPAALDDWLLYVLHSPNASGSRGLSQGGIYSRDGHLVASTAQEGLMRHRPEGAG
ncbi:acyl-CoA thioesterase II [Steroidobacter denitrificans]|uniref:Acyl-CoA thioesterase 2 n=1 Tax=Steroidobacter denitrificans TaxID=465721 RepID=A0A127F8H6_STEDE|nr:acyl-CoA thioesterase II [Steroidobacter denitrificans]AMN45941.1 acyl-CoA thioesterase II [Steroidobacter denitrificans]